MSETAPKGHYVYQPDPPRKDGRMYGVGGLPMSSDLRGLTKDEAEVIVEALNDICWLTERCAACGHRFAFASGSCPQCGEQACAPWQEPSKWPETCDCPRCSAARR